MTVEQECVPELRALMDLSIIGPPPFVFVETEMGLGCGVKRL